MRLRWFRRNPHPGLTCAEAQCILDDYRALSARQRQLIDDQSDYIDEIEARLSDIRFTDIIDRNYGDDPT